MCAEPDGSNGFGNCGDRPRHRHDAHDNQAKTVHRVHEGMRADVRQPSTPPSGQVTAKFPPDAQGRLRREPRSLAPLLIALVAPPTWVASGVATGALVSLAGLGAIAAAAGGASRLRAAGRLAICGAPTMAVTYAVGAAGARRSESR